AAALQATANAIVITDIKSEILWVNPAFTKLTGYEATEAIGQTTRLLRSGRHSQPFYENLWGTIQRGAVWEDEIINRRKDGTEYFEHQTITPVREGQGQITHFIAVKQDITERRRVAEALREAELKYRTLVEQMPAVVYIDAPDEIGTSSYVSPQVETLLGYPYHEWESDPFYW